jgi:hypothetical protein
VNALRATGQLADAYQVGVRAQCREPLFRLALAARETEPDLAKRALLSGVAALVMHKNWDAIGTALSATGFRPTADWPEEASKWLQMQKPAILATLIRIMARLSDISDAPEQFQRDWQRFLRDYLRVKDGQWMDLVSLEEAGAAIERAGRFTDAISFYEAVRSPPFSEDERLFAKRRWLVNKDRQLKHELQQGASGRTRQIERDLRQAMASLGVRSLDDLGSYPQLKAMDNAWLDRQSMVDDKARIGTTAHEIVPEVGVETTDLPRQVSIALGAYELELSRAVRRLNITNRETMETAFVKIESRECGGEVDFESTGDDLWTCTKWNLSVRLPTKERPFITVRAESLAVSADLRV